MNEATLEARLNAAETNGATAGGRVGKEIENVESKE
jgi:hypothetical protein